MSTLYIDLKTGNIPSFIPRETGLQPLVMKDETGSIVGIQGNDLSLAESIPLIKSIREKQVLKKAMPEKHSVIGTCKMIEKSTMMKSVTSNLDDINRKLDLLKAGMCLS